MYVPVNNKKICFILVFLLLFSITASQVSAKDYVIGEHKIPVAKPDPSSTYVGSEKCKTCHLEKYNDWKTSGHPYKLLTPDEAKPFNIPTPDGYTYDDIYLVIGGWGWKSRFMDQNGYIITKTGPDRNTNGSNQYNVATKKWVDYHAGETLKFDCGNCHTTGYSLAGNQSNKAGIIGTWEEKSIGCEDCHGPGSEHILKGGGKGVAIIKDNSSALCGRCHTRGADDNKIIASGGKFIDHHEQYPEILNSPHKSLDCTSCHDPHKGSHAGQTNPTGPAAGIRTKCPVCHPQQATDFKDSTMKKEGVECSDCHMPMATRSAVGDEAKFKGDVKTHLFKINTDPNAKMFSDDGKFANGYLTLDFACLSCHDTKDKAWAASYAKDNLHKFVKAEATPTEPTTTTPPAKSPGFEILFAIGALLVSIIARRR